MQFERTSPDDLHALSPRELIRGLMRGNRAELKLGYSQGFSDGMQGSPTMVIEEDPANAENTAYREGYADGLDEDTALAYPSEQAV